MPTFPITGLTLEMRELADGQLYEYGVVVEGAWIRLAVTKTGGVNADIARAAASSEDTSVTPAA